MRAAAVRSAEELDVEGRILSSLFLFQSIVLVILSTGCNLSDGQRALEHIYIITMDGFVRYCHGHAVLFQ